jgi:hypothetical protein
MRETSNWSLNYETIINLVLEKNIIDKLFIKEKGPTKIRDSDVNTMINHPKIK